MLIVESCFPGGAVEDVRFVNNDEVRFRAPLDGSPRGMWFWFRIRNGAGRRLKLVQTNLNQMLGASGYDKVVPVWREGGGIWSRVDRRNVCVKVDENRIIMSVSPRTDNFEVAFCYPYVLDDFSAFLSRMPSEYFQLDYLGLTAEGRRFPVLMVGGADRRQESLVVCTARH